MSHIVTPDINAEIRGAGSIGAFIRSRILDRTPWIFGGDFGAFASWQGAIRSSGGINRAEIYVIGSAGTGYSMKPGSLGRPFRTLGSPSGASDVDVAVVDPLLFVGLWDSVVAQDVRRGLGPVLRSVFGSKEELPSLLEAMRTRIYWGMVAERLAEPGTALASRVRTILSAAGRDRRIQGYRVNARVYRRRGDLEQYLGYGLRQSPAAPTG